MTENVGPDQIITNDNLLFSQRCLSDLNNHLQAVFLVCSLNLCLFYTWSVFIQWICSCPFGLCRLHKHVSQPRAWDHFQIYFIVSSGLAALFGVTPSSMGIQEGMPVFSWRAQHLQALRESEKILFSPAVGSCNSRVCNKLKILKPSKGFPSLSSVCSLRWRGPRGGQTRSCTSPEPNPSLGRELLHRKVTWRSSKTRSGSPVMFF